jgi:hypothetical protein
MADGNTALPRVARAWYQVDDEDWVVDFEGPDGIYPETYRTTDFQDAMDVVAAWRNDGKLPAGIRRANP